MDTIEKALKIANIFVQYIKKLKLHGTEEILINTDHPHQRYLIKIFISETQNEVVFKKVEGSAFIIISNGQKIGSKNEFEFHQLLEILEIAGVKLLEKTIKPREKKPLKVRIKRNKKEQMDRLLDRYNDYGLLYETLQNEKYLKKQQRLIALLKKMKKPKQ